MMAPDLTLQGQSPWSNLGLRELLRDSVLVVLEMESLGAAGRLVLDIMQSDWEPLSQRELDHRLDQAVEEMIEADLMSSLQGHCVPVLMQVSSPQEDFISFGQEQAVTVRVSDPPVSSVYQGQESEPQHVEDLEENTTVQYVTALLQNSNSSHSQSRLSGRARLSLSNTVFLSLSLLSKRQSYRSVSSTFHLEKGNIHRIFFSFCERINSLEHQLICWPTGQDAVDHLLPFCSWLGWDESLEERGLPRVLGVLGHTRIPIRLPISKQDAESDAPDTKRLKKEPHPDSWLNLELVCNSEGRFIHCCITRGSEKDRGGVLSETLKKNPDPMPPGTCLVARVGYPLTAHILTPFCPAQSPQENLYNRSLETHLGRFEQAVAGLKERFQKLRYLDMANFERAKAVVLCSCILHNAFLDMGLVTKGQAEREMRGDDEKYEKDEGGVKLRDSVANILYSALESGTN